MNEIQIKKFIFQKIKKFLICNIKRHYAFLLSNNTIISKGENSFIVDKTCTTIHAELDALKKIIKLKQCPKQLDIMVIKTDSNGNYGKAKPCSHCLYVLSNSKYKIRNVYYTSIDENNEEIIIIEKFNKMVNLRDKVCSKALRYKCGEKIYYEN